MHPRISEVLDCLEATRADLNGAIASVVPESRDQRPALERWSVAEIIEHLAITEGRVAKLVAGKLAAAKAAGLRAETETSSILDSIPRERIRDRSQKRTAPEIVQPRAEHDTAAAIAMLQQTRADLRATLLAHDGLALGEISHEHPVLGVINIYQWVLFVGAHEARHTEQVREIAGQRT